MTGKVLFFVLLFSSFNLYSQTVSKTPQNNTKDELIEHLGAAETFQISGDLENAALENRAVAGIALQRIANVAIEEGRFHAAVEILNRSLAYRDNEFGRINLAVAHVRLNQFDEAQAAAQQAVKLAPDYAYARYVLGNIFFTKEEYQLALPELEKVMILDPNFDAAHALGLTYLHLKQLSRAKLLFEEIQGALKEPRAELHVIFGQAFEQTNYPLESEREFKRALAINPKQPRASFFLGFVILQYGGSGRLAEAAIAFERELLLTPDDFFANFFAGVAASSENDHVKAALLLKKATILNPSSSEALLFLGQSEMEVGDLKSAEKTLRRSIELSVESSKNGYESRRAYYMLGRLLLNSGRREEGEKALLKARELQTKLIVTTRDELSILFSQVAETSKGLPRSEVKPPKSVSDGAITDQTENSGEFKRLKEYLSDILAQAFYNLAVIEVQKQRYPEALENFAQAAVWKPGFPNLDRNWGIVSFRSGSFEKAIAPLARHLKVNAEDVLARQMLGTSYYFVGDFAKTIETLKPLEASILSDAELAYFYGVSFIQQKRNKEAEVIFEAMAKSSQNAPETLNYAAQGFMFLGNYERAIKEFRTVSSLAPQLPKVNFFVGQSFIRLNRQDEAEKAYLQELKINPVDESAKYHLALTLIERKVRTAEAVNLLNEAISIRPDYADAHYQLGKIHLETGEVPEAIIRLEAAANADGKKDYIHYQLSIAYRKASRKEDADRELKIYQALKSANRSNESLTPMGTDKNVP